MARCFPYPRPSFVVEDKAYDQALIESIKLRKEREMVRPEKKERKREKKEKGEKKEKQKRAGKIVGNDEKTHQGQKSITDSRKKDIQKGKEFDQLERSDISEEHEPPYYSQKLCYSSDCTQNGESLRLTLPSDSSCSRVGNVLRIRLKRKKPDASPREEQSCSTSGQHDVSIHQIHEISHQPNQGLQFQLKRNEPGASLRVKQRCSTSGRTDIRAEQNHGNTCGPIQNPSCSDVVIGVSSKGLTAASLMVEQSRATSVWTDIHAEQKNGIVHMPSHDPPCPAVGTVVSSKGLTSKFENEEHHFIAGNAEAASKTVSKMEGPESLDQALIENWVPPKFQFERTDSDDLEWLFDTKRRNIERAERAKVGEESVSNGCAVTWPHALFLQEADIHALPFTVPF